MTTTEPETPPTEAPAGEETGDGLRLVTTGWVRCTVGGALYRLRPPFFGEMKRLRMSLEEIQDHLAEASTEAEGIAMRLIDQANATLQGDGAKVDQADRLVQTKALRRESTMAGRALTELRESLMFGWWDDVFRVLCVDLAKVDWLDDPDRHPSWMTNASLPASVVGHWRQPPLGHG